MIANGSGIAAITLRRPTKDDGYRLHQLIAQCPPLDTNSIYCNLLQCSHFADTAVVAERAGDMVGSVTGYRLPARPETLFIWQVAVHEQARGQGLARRMLEAIVSREECRGITHLETTITADNAASWGLFRGFARHLGAEISWSEHFRQAEHFGGQHASEFLVRIGPFAGTGQSPQPALATESRSKRS